MNKLIRVKDGEDGKINNFNYTPVPYNVNYNLYSFTIQRKWSTNYRTNFTLLST